MLPLIRIQRTRESIVVAKGGKVMLSGLEHRPMARHFSRSCNQPAGDPSPEVSDRVHAQSLEALENRGRLGSPEGIPISLPRASTTATGMVP